MMDIQSLLRDIAEESLVGVSQDEDREGISKLDIDSLANAIQNLVRNPVYQFLLDSLAKQIHVKSTDLVFHHLRNSDFAAAQRQADYRALCQEILGALKDQVNFTSARIEAALCEARIQEASREPEDFSDG